MAREWNIEQTLCIRLFQAMRETDPLITLQRLPAPATLRKVILAARKAGVDD